MVDINLLSVELCVGYGVSLKELCDNVGKDETVVFAVYEVVKDYGNHVVLIGEVCIDELCNRFNNILGKD